MKIGIDIRLIGKKRTGDEAVFFNLVKNLAEIDSKNEYQLFTDIVEEKILEEIKNSLEIAGKNNFNIISLKTKNKFTWNFWTLPKYLRKNPVNIYLTQYITPFFVPKKIKIFTIIHDISFNFYPQLIKKSDLFFLKTLIPLSLRRANKIIAVSEFTKNELEKYYKIAPEKISVMHNATGDNFSQIEMTSQKLQTVREKYHLPDKFILYLGTMQPRKNLSTLIEAFNKIHYENKNIKLVLAGGKGHNYDTSIDSTIKKYSLEKEVLLPGFIDEEDKPALYKLTEIFVFPSFYEGFGIPILEAMVSDLPVIASDIPPHKEIAGNAILFFNPQDFKDLAEKIKLLLENPDLREEFAKLRQEQVKKFSWKRSAEKFLNVLNSGS